LYDLSLQKGIIQRRHGPYVLDYLLEMLWIPTFKNILESGGNRAKALEGPTREHEQ
jgi:hypothetical protein